jgi:hypothetical protein
MKRLLPLLLAFGLPGLSLGQDADTCATPTPPTATRCGSAETFDACQARLNGVKIINPEVALANTGDASGLGINDFLPLLRVLLNNGDEPNGDGKIGIEWSDPLKFGEKFPNKVGVSLQKPDVYEPLAEALQAASLDDELSGLKDDVDERDDVSLSLSFGVANRRFGRDPRLHQDLTQKLLAQADARDPGAATLLNDLAKFEREHHIDATEENVPFCKRPLAVQDEYIGFVSKLIVAERDSLKALNTRLEKAGFSGLMELIGNQPQISFTASYRSRDEAAGPDEFKASFSFEQGLKNVNDLRSTCSTLDFGCFTRFIGTDAEKIRNARRVSFTADYTKLSRLEFVLPAPGFSYLAEASERLTANLTLSGYIGKEMSDNRRSRYDLTASYEDFSDDPARQDRGIARVTVTYPLSPGFFLSLGAVYATKPEFRGDVDEEISARAGFLYKIIEDQ